MFLSIIIPIYNDEQFLSECLESCLDQDYPSNDYEIICVDDGSTDRSREILLEYAEKYQNIIPVLKKHGLPTGRTVGFEKANGDYIWFVDHDDIVAPNALVEIKKAVDSNEGIDRIAFPYYEFFESLTPVEQRLLQEGALVPNAGDSLSTLALWSGVIRREFMKKNDIWPSSKRIEAAGKYWGIEQFRPWGGDNICMEECFDCGMQTKTLLGKPLYFYRQHNASETMSLTPDMIESRRMRRFHSALLRGYLAAQLKEKYLLERAVSGRASSETAVAMIMKLRMCVIELNQLPRGLWSKGISMMKEKDLLLLHKPPEYSFSFRDYLRTRTRKEKLSLSSFAYYTYTLAGARWFRILSFFTRLRTINPKMTQRYRKYKLKRILKHSTKASM